MDDIAQQLAIRDSFRKKLSLRKTPVQRMREMAMRQGSLSDWAQRSPEGYQRFLRRNFKARAIDIGGCNDR